MPFGLSGTETLLFVGSALDAFPKNRSQTSELAVCAKAKGILAVWKAELLTPWTPRLAHGMQYVRKQPVAMTDCLDAQVVPTPGLHRTFRTHHGRHECGAVGTSDLVVLLVIIIFVIVAIIHAIIAIMVILDIALVYILLFRMRR